LAAEAKSNHAACNRLVHFSYYGALGADNNLTPPERIYNIGISIGSQSYCTIDLAPKDLRLNFIS
jgi:hypothetical protein